MNTELTLDWVGDLALRGSVLLAVVLAVGLMLRRVSAGQRYGLWLAALLGLIGLPALLSWGPAWRVLPNFESQPFPVTEERFETVDWEPVAVPTTPRMVEAPSPTRLPAPSVTEPSVTPSPISPAPPFDWSALIAWLPLLWLFGVTVGLAGLFVSLGRLRHLREKRPTPELPSLTEIAQELSLHRTPRLVLGPPDAVPMVWGVWHPCLLLPEGFQDWPQAKLRTVLLHELAHLVRRDPLALMLGQFARVLHWFNPLAWLTLNQMRADQERACDDTVLRHGVRASDYAQVLLDLSQQRRPVAGLSLCALAMARPGPVEQRLVAILDGKCPRASATRSWRLLWTALVLTVALPLALLHAVESAKVRGQIVDRNGVVLAKTKADGLRVYPQKDLAAHVVGYAEGESDGRAGIEKDQNAELAEGNEIKLTLDLRLQKLTREALKSVLAEQRLDRGAVIVLEPNSGEVLAMVSEPGFDPNDFVPTVSKEKWEALIGDWRRPMLDRTVNQYAPGSSFKLISGLVAAQAGVWNEVFECTGAVQYGSKAMQCWIGQKGASHGELKLSEAMMRSCSCYWYQSGNKAGIEAFQQVGTHLGLGQRYGLLEQEQPGILPSPEWLQKHKPKEKWSEGHTANTAIGQGFTLTSPLQMAVVAATIANRGNVPRPQLLLTNEPSQAATDLTALGMNAEGIEEVRHGMWKVVNDEEGTGKSARMEGIEVAGKTGTAQFWRVENGKKIKDNHTWFVGFAPYENPKIAFAVMIQGGFSGGGTAAPVAKRLVEQYLGLPVNRVSPTEATQPAPQIEDGEADQQANDAKPSVPFQDPADRARNWTPIDEERPSADTVRRWELVRDEGMLGDLPKGARGLISRLKGSWPRQVELQFVAPEKEVLSWLEFSPGRVRHQNFLYPVESDSLLATTQSQTTINMNSITYMVSGSILHHNADWQEDWKQVRGKIRAGRTGYLGSMQGEQGISVSFSKQQEAEIEVTITRPPSRPPQL